MSNLLPFNGRRASASIFLFYILDEKLPEAGYMAGDGAYFRLGKFVPGDFHVVRQTDGYMTCKRLRLEPDGRIYMLSGRLDSPDRPISQDQILGHVERFYRADEVCVIVNINEAEAAARRRKEYPRRVPGLPDEYVCAWAVDEKGVGTYIGDTLTELTGLPAVVLSNPAEYMQTYHPDHRDRVSAVFLDCLVTKRDFEVEAPMISADGVYRTVLVTGRFCRRTRTWRGTIEFVGLYAARRVLDESHEAMAS